MFLLLNRLTLLGCFLDAHALLCSGLGQYDAVSASFHYLLGLVAIGHRVAVLDICCRAELNQLLLTLVCLSHKHELALLFSGSLAPLAP